MTTIHRIPCPIPFPLKTVNCYFIGGKRPTLIDTGVDTPACLDSLDRAIRSTGNHIENLERIILTHVHTDHAGLAGKLARISGAEVFVHHWDQPKIVYGDPEKTDRHLRRFRRFLKLAGISGRMAQAMSQAFSRRLESLVTPIAPLRILSGGEIFQFDDFNLRVIHTPGHSAGSVCLFNEGNGDILAGDTLLENITPNPVAEFNLPQSQSGYLSIPQYLKSLEVISQLPVTRVFPGHGPVFFNVHHRVEELKRHFERRKKAVAHWLSRHAAGLKTAADGVSLHGLTRGLFPGIGGLELFLALSESFAYLQLLESEERVTSRVENGVRRYVMSRE